MATALHVRQRGHYGPRTGHRVIVEPVKATAIAGGASFGLQVLPGDTLYLATVTLQNVQPGSNYWLARSATGAVLATGAQGGTAADIVLTAIPAVALADDVILRVRAYGATKWLPFETHAYLTRAGATIFVAQQPDTIGA